MDRLSTCLHFTLNYEGGYSNNPADSGGETNYGITHVTYDAYRIGKKLPTQSVKLITTDEVHDIYLNKYWLQSHCNGLLPPLDEAMFDTAVNFGVGRAVEFLARALGLPDTMVWTSAMSDKVHSADPKALALSICTQRDKWRLDRVAAHASQKVFLKGWQRRDAALRAQVNAWSNLSTTIKTS